MFLLILMLSRSFFPNFGQGNFPKIAGKSPELIGNAKANGGLGATQLGNKLIFLQSMDWPKIKKIRKKILMTSFICRLI